MTAIWQRSAQALLSAGKPKFETGKRRIGSRKKLALKAKKLEIEVVAKKKAYKLQEQNIKMQAEYSQFFKEQFSRRKSDGNNNRGASNETRDE